MGTNHYKLSVYNNLFTRDGSTYIWNTLSDALVKLGEDGKAYLESFTGSEDGTTYFDVLTSNGFVVPNAMDECAMVMADELRTMCDTNPSVLHFTIAPGLGCNYKCWYCFEQTRESRDSLTDAGANDVCDYILGIADACPGLRNLGITWFGGEPLLYLETIERLSDRIRGWCSVRDIAYGAGIVTNGRLLTPQVATRLAACEVGYVQLAIDGTAEHYARAKGASVSDFDATIQNVVESSGIIPITVRINVSEDIDDALALTDCLLAENHLDGKIKVYVARIRDYGGDVTPQMEREEHRRFLELEGKYMFHFGTGGKYDLSSLAFIRPRRRRTTCLSVCGHNVCIGPQGELYRCEHYFGQPQYSVGSIHDVDVPPNTYTSIKHLPQCLKCSVFPICLGGCKNDVTDGEPILACKELKERFIDHLMLSTQQPHRKCERR